MKVEVLGSINSGKHNRGDIINLPDAEAEKLIASGAAKATNKKAEKKEPSTTKPKTKAEEKKAKAKAKAEAKKAKAEAKAKAKAEAEAKSNGEK